MLRKRLNKLTKDVLIDLICAYNDYIFIDHEDELNRMDRAPVCVEEFMDDEIDDAEYKASIKILEGNKWLRDEKDGKIKVTRNMARRLLFYDEGEANVVLELLNDTYPLCFVLIDENK